MEPPIRSFSKCLNILAVSIALSAHGLNAVPIETQLNSAGQAVQKALVSSEGHAVPPGSPDYYFRLAVCAVLVLTGGLLAGLTLGLMSLDETNLHILATSGTEQQKRYAQRIQPLRKNGHWLLVTLLLGNTVVNETLPIVMDSIFGGGVTAVVISTAAIVLFGEIIPQSLCARYGLSIGAFFAYPVRLLQLILSPLGYPIALLLDYVLGADHGVTYKKAELKELVSLSDMAHGGNLSNDEVTIIRGALELSEKMVSDVMTDLSNVYMVDVNARLNRKLLTEMLRRGHSRVPVFDGERVNIVGVLLVKSLILLDPDDCTPVSEAKITPIPLVTTDTSLYDILNAFQEGGSHMAVVMGPPPPSPSAAGHKIGPLATSQSTLVTSATPLLRDSSISTSATQGAGGLQKRNVTPFMRRKSSYIIGTNSSGNGSGSGSGSSNGSSVEPGLSFCLSDDELHTFMPIGIITLEDVIEELIQEEIIDETDVFVDMRKRIKVVRATVASNATAVVQATSIRLSHNPSPIIKEQRYTAALPLNPRSGGYDGLKRQYRGVAFSSRRRQKAQEFGGGDDGDKDGMAADSGVATRPQSFPSSCMSNEETTAATVGSTSLWSGHPAALAHASDDSDSRSI